MKSKFLKSATLLLVALGISSMAYAEKNSVAGQIKVKLLIEQGCEIDNHINTPEWGTLDFGKHPLTWGQDITAELSGDAELKVTCDSGVTGPTITFDAGGSKSDSRSLVSVADATQLIKYDIYQAANRVEPYPVNQAVKLKGDKGKYTIPLYAKIAKGSAQTAGEYTDTLNATLAW